MRLVPWLVALFCLVAAVAFAVAGYASERNAESVKRQLEARDRLADQTAARFLPIPSATTSETYGPPYNVTIRCEVEGSGEGENGARVRLDLSRAPVSGDVYRKTCRAT